jgi:iron complex transport system permease protein
MKRRTDFAPSRRMSVVFTSLCACVLVAISTLVGSTNIDLSNLFVSGSDAQIFWRLRVPRAVFGALVGGALGVCGAAYQSLFRNPLVCPFSLGVSSAGACGAAAAIAFAGALHVQIVGVELAGGIAGAAVGVAMVLLCARWLRDHSGPHLLLCGVVLGFVFSSAVTLLQYVSNYSELFRITRWMFGSLQVSGFVEVGIVGAITIVSVSFLLARHRELDLLACGLDSAKTRGVDVQRYVNTLLIISSILVGALVAFGGVIGFVGIMVPHAVRAIWGGEAKMNLTMSFICGGALVVACDTIGRVLIPPYEIPVGVITSALGGPLFIVILLRQRRAGLV